MRLPATSLGANRKRLVLVLAAVGASTFFMPMVVLNPPLFNRTSWSPLNIAVNVFQGKLPVAGGHFDECLIEIAVIYLLLPCVLLAAYRPGAPRAFVFFTFIGLVFGSLGRFWEHGFLYVFGWNYFGRGGMSRGPAWWILPWIMPALLAVGLARGLDGPGQANEETLHDEDPQLTTSTGS